jgi:WD40 repeat protein
MTDQNTSEYRYWAFISYSSKDAAQAKWLHRAVETYGIPAKLVEHGHETPVGEPAPKRFQPIFRDRDELPASADLGQAILDALRASRYLVVICSPNASRSQWVNREVENFVEMGRGDRIFAYIMDGEPNSGDERECFPHALREQEPLAADARRQGDGRDNAKLKLLAGMLGVTFDALKQREAQRRIRRLQLAIAAALILALAFGGLAWYANQARGRALVAEGNAVTEAHVRATAEANAVNEAEARATAQASAENRRREADSQRRLGLARQLAAQAGTVLQSADDPELGLLLALTARQIAAREATTLTLEANDALGLALRSAPIKVMRHDGEIYRALFSPNGRRVLTDGTDQMLRLWDANDGTRLLELYGAGSVDTWDHRTSFSPDGERLVTTISITLYLIDADLGAILSQPRFDAPPGYEINHDGSRLVAADGEKVRLFNMASGAELPCCQHSGAVDNGLFSPDGRWLASSGTDGVILTDARTGREIVRACPGGRVDLIRFSASSKWFACADDNANINIVDIMNERITGQVAAARRDLVFSPDETRLLVTYYSGRAYLLATANGAVTAQVAEIKDLVAWKFSPDGSRLLFAGKDGTRYLIASDDGRVVARMSSQAQQHDAEFNAAGSRFAAPVAKNRLGLWDAGTGRLLGSFSYRADGTWDYDPYSFTPDGKRLLVAGDDKNVALVNAETGTVIRRAPFTGDHPFVVSPDGRYALIPATEPSWFLLDLATGGPPQDLTCGSGGEDAEFVADGARLLTTSLSGVLCLWNPGTRAKLAQAVTTGLSIELTDDDRSFLAGVDGNLAILDTADGHKIATIPAHAYRYAHLSPDGQRVITTAPNDDAVYLWSPAASPGVQRISLPGLVTALAYAPGGTRLAAASGKNVWLVDAVSGSTISRLEHPGKVNAISFSPDGGRLAASLDNTLPITDNLHLWDIGTSGLLGVFPGDMLTGVTFSPDGESLVTNTAILPVAEYATDYGGKDPSVTHVIAGVPPVHALQIDNARDSYAVAFSSDGRQILAGGSAEATVWDVVSRKAVLQVSHGPDTTVTAVAFSPDKTRFATGGNDLTVRVWDAATGRQLLRLDHQGELMQVAFDTTGRRLITNDGTTRLYDAATGLEVAQLGQEDRVKRFSMNPDGDHLATVDANGTVHLWTLEDGRQIARLSHIGTVSLLMFSNDGRYLATTSDGSSVHLWDAHNGMELLRPPNGSTSSAVAFSPDGEYLAIGGGAEITIYSTSIDRLSAAGCRVLSRNLSLLEWQNYAAGEPYQATCPGLQTLDAIPEPEREAGPGA